MNNYKRPLQFIKYLLPTLFLFLFTLLLTQPVFASVHRSLAVLVGTPIPTDAAGAPTDKSFALARVSVVRLLVSYTDSNNPSKTVANCTGLGVLIKSLPASNTPPGNSMPNDWVLTDSSLVHPTQPLCTSGLTGKIAQIQIDFNTTYNSKKPVTVKLDSNSTPSVNNAITCLDPANCNNGPALIAFQGEEAPFVDLAPLSSGNTDHALIALADVSGKVMPTATDNAADFLIPQPLDPNTGSQLEAGAPLIDDQGRLTGLHSLSASSSLILLGDIFYLLQEVPASASASGNTVNTNWNKGIDAYYTQNYADALADFQQAARDNPNFQGASDFANFATKAQNPVSPTPTPAPSGTVVIPGLNLSIELWQLSILILLFLILLFLLTWLFLRSRVKRRRAFEAELDEAERRVAIADQQTDLLENAHRAWIGSNLVFEQPIPFLREKYNLQKKMAMPKVSSPCCPHCGEQVAYNTNYCSNCCLVLSPSESGQHLRIPPSPSSAPSAKTLTPRVEFDTTDIRADINAGQIMDQEGGYQYQKIYFHKRQHT